jgi:hypothetical protein
LRWNAATKNGIALRNTAIAAPRMPIGLTARQL